MQLINIKQISLDQAIKANTGSAYDDKGRHITNPDKVVEAAKKFEAYLKETPNV